MPLPRLLNQSLLTFVLIAGTAAHQALPAQSPRERISEENGQIRFAAELRDAHLRNPALPEAEEDAYWERANYVIRHFDGRIGVRTEGEQEKESFPITMFSYLTGNHDTVISALQTRDNQAGTDHAWTGGFDFYWGFTVKGQMRKYFLFGPDLDSDYRERMKAGAQIWTAENPRPSFELVHSLRSEDPEVREYALELLNIFRKNLHELPEDAIQGTVRDRYADQDLGDDPDAWETWWKQYSAQGWQVYEDLERLANPYPHPLHGVGSGPVGARWDPGVRGMRADARNTDNLRAMRDISVYLMAEETGNERVRKLYADKIRRFVSNLYRVHHGEWDSENYLHHTVAPYHNLYDFAQDEEMVLLAKAALDYMYTAAAVKYYNGLAVAPTKRTGGGLNSFMWLWFGDIKHPPARPYYDLLHVITSSYRPPLATIQIGRGEFPRPAEMVNTKPTYSYWLPGLAEQPETWETVYYGKSFYLGTAVSRSAQGDVRPWDLAMDTGDGQARLFRANSGNNVNGLRRGDQIGQFRNLVVWLREDDNARFIFEAPGQSEAVQEDGIWFLNHGLTYLAIYPIGLDLAELGKVNDRSDGNHRINVSQRGGQFAGFALEVADASDHRNFGHFRNQVRSRGGLDLDQISAGEVTLTGSSGQTLGFTYARDDSRPRIVRDGEAFSWDENLHVYQPMDDHAPVRVDWQGEFLRLDTGDAFFFQKVTPTGEVSFTADREKAPEVD